MKTIKITSLFLACLVTFNMFAQKQVPMPKKYIAYFTSNPIKIDGKADEKEWQKAPWTDSFIDIEGVIKPKYNTQVKMLWDNDYMYFYAELEEEHVWATLKQRDTVIFYNHDFEIFIDPDGDTHNYYEFEVNAFNTVWDLFLQRPYRNNTIVIDNWDINGLKSAVNINGTINNPKDIDKGWSVEVAIPWSVLEEAATKNGVPKGKIWRVNFSRVNRQLGIVDDKYIMKRNKNGKFLPEYNWVWSPQWVIAMHQPETWGFVYFSENKVGNKDKFNIPQEQKIIQFLYYYYRQIMSIKDSNERNNKVINFNKKPLNYNGNKLKVNYVQNIMGWGIYITYNNKTYLVKDNGRLIIK